MDNSGNSGVLPLVGIVLLILAVLIGLGNVISQIRDSQDSAGNPLDNLPLLGSSFIWYGLAIVLLFLGLLLIFLGRG